MLCYNDKGYSIACDKCGKTLSQGGRTVFSSAYAAVETAKTLGWKSNKSSPFEDQCRECSVKK